MVDARGFDTTIVQVRNKNELDMILERMDDEEGVTLLKDLTFDYEFLEEGRSLSLIGRDPVSTKSDMFAAIDANHELKDDGKYVPPIQFCFFALDSVTKAVEGLADTLAKTAVEREQKDFNKRAFAEAGIGKDEKFAYAHKNREWVVPETSSDDPRASTERFVSGGTPKALGETDAPATSSSVQPVRRITKYATGEPDEKKKTQKVYIEQEEVVNVDHTRIKVDFTQNSYTVKVNTFAATYVLGPIDCGHIIPSSCSWRLSKGKRITITLSGWKAQDYDEMVKEHMSKPQGFENWQVLGAVFAFMLAVIVLMLIGGK